MRVKGWEKALNRVLEKHAAIGGEDYAHSNCYILPDDAVLAITGKRMHPAMYRGGAAPKTAKGAAKRLFKHGFANVQEAFIAAFEKIPVSQAQRGDLMILRIDGEYSGGVLTSIGVAVVTEQGLQYVPRENADSAYKVG